MLFLQYHNTILFVPDVLPDMTIKSLKAYVRERYTIPNIHVLDLGRILSDSEFIRKQYYTFTPSRSLL